MKTIALILAFVTGLASAQTAAPVSFEDQVKNFVKEVNASPFATQMQAEEFQKAWATTGVDGAYISQIDRSLKALLEPKDSLERYQRLESLEKLNYSASQIVNRLLKQPVVDINLALMTLMHAYLFDSEQRFAVSMIFDTIASYKFSELDLKRMKQDASRLNQFTKGSLNAFTFAAIAAIIVSPKVWPKIWQNIARVESKVHVERVAERVAGPSLHPLDRGGVITTDEALQLMERMGARIGNASTSGTVQVASRVSKARVYDWVMKMRSSYGFKSYAAVTGIAVAGGAANIGWHALSDVMYEKDFSNTLVNPSELRDDFYDGLAVLKLSCDTGALLQSAKTAKVEDLPRISKGLINLFSEYSLLTILAPKWMQPTVLPEGIRAEPGNIVVTLQIKGKTVEEKMACGKFTSKEPRVDTSLLEILSNLTEVFYKVKELTPPAPEAPDPAKAAKAAAPGAAASAAKEKLK